MNFTQFLKLLLDNKLFGLIAAIFTANGLEEKWDAVMNLVAAIKPIIIGLLSGTTALTACSEAEAAVIENEACEALAAASPEVSALAIGDRLRRLKEIWDSISPILRLIGVPVPQLPFAGT